MQRYREAPGSVNVTKAEKRSSRASTVSATLALMTCLSKSTCRDRFRCLVTHLVKEEKEHGSEDMMIDPVTAERLNTQSD